MKEFWFAAGLVQENFVVCCRYCSQSFVVMLYVLYSKAILFEILFRKAVYFAAHSCSGELCFFCFFFAV